MIVIARSAKRAVATQLDCFGVLRSGTPRGLRVSACSRHRQGKDSNLSLKSAVANCSSWLRTR